MISNSLLGIERLSFVDCGSWSAYATFVFTWRITMPTESTDLILVAGAEDEAGAIF